MSKESSKSTLNNYWEKNKGFRQSMDNIVPPIFKDKDVMDIQENKTIIDKINEKLMEINEIKYISQKTKIKPFYYLIILIIVCFFILIGYFSTKLTIIIATFYPLFMTFKLLKDVEDINDEKRKEIIHWLKYWIFFCVFLIFECFFGVFLKKKIYFILKVIFLISCFPMDSRLTITIYNSCRNLVKKYEPYIVNGCKSVYEHLLDLKQEKMKELNKKKDGEDSYDKSSFSDIKKYGAMKIMEKLY